MACAISFKDLASSLKHCQNGLQVHAGKLLSEIWWIKGLAEQVYGPQHPITKKLASMHEACTEIVAGLILSSQAKKLFGVLRPSMVRGEGDLPISQRVPVLLTPIIPECII
jgi:hypothetical protein